MRAALINSAIYVVYAFLMAGYYHGSLALDQPIEPLGVVLYAVACGACIVAALTAHRTWLWWGISGTAIVVATVWRLLTLLFHAVDLRTSTTPPDSVILATTAYTNILISTPFVWHYAWRRHAVDFDNRLL